MAKKVNIADTLIAEELGESTPELPDDMAPWMRRTILVVDGFSSFVGYIVCFLVLPLIAAMSIEIFMRYFFLQPTVWAYDLSRMMYGAMFMLGAGYALMKGVHIRADFLYRLWPARVQAGVDLGLYLVLYFPSLIVFLWYSLDFAQTAWMRGERGMDTAWMPYLAPVKTALAAGIALLLIQGISEVLKCWYALRKGRWPA
ncbi:MAG TPA: TRAP transporter small permease subunit [Aestuariivirgaceae bacterium]|nr:TRAP transporter small permease subunit [Aestuariivirgaceae bacterium]